MPLTYDAALEFLFPRTTQIKFGLDATRALLGAVGDPQRMWPAVHVAGTNGKGSTSTLIAAALQEHGLRVGLYTSPHLVSFRERIRVDGVPISEMAVASWTSHLRPAIEEHDATFFEATTAIAFAHFAAMQVDIAVIEVGLGGRLDSTNVITPLVSVVTHIALDHQKYLGDTIELIAREKAGIAKPGVPFVIGEPDGSVAKTLATAAIAATQTLAWRGATEGPSEEDRLFERAQRASSGPTVEGTPPRDPLHQPLAIIQVDPTDVYTGPLALHGAHQRRNAAVARAALQQLPAPFVPTDDEITHAFAHASIPGRLDKRGKWLFDVAHNPDGMRALVAALDEMNLPRPIHAVVSILGDKAWPEMLVALDQAIDVGILTEAPTAAGRKWEPEWLERWLADPSRPPARARWRHVPDFTQALADAERGAGTILVTGSFHTVGDVMVARGFEAS